MLAIRQMGGLDAIKDGLKDFAFQQASVDETLKRDWSRILPSTKTVFDVAQQCDEHTRLDIVKKKAGG
jgi:hypothetical protein